MNEKDFEKLMELTHQVQKKEEQIQKLINKMNTDGRENFYLNTISFYTEMMPEIHDKYGGEIETWDVAWGREGSFDARLKLDGVVFRAIQIDPEERERYGIKSDSDC